MQQIADWLKKLGMSEYTDRFVENRIDLSVLPDLTDQDLKDLGVLLGDRRNCCARSAISSTLRLPSRHAWWPRRASQLGDTTPRVAS